MPALDPRREIVVYCRSGARSARAARDLRAAGFRVSSLAGGILRWDADVGATTG
jgi:adenylyltransferase/sulfurtransferase